MAHAGTRAPKQWPLTTNETVNSFENWRGNLMYILSLDANFASFLEPGATWLKRTTANPNRGLTDDPEAANPRVMAAQKLYRLDLMLGQIANFCPIISRNRIIRDSVSLNDVWQAIRLHFGFHTTGARFIDLAYIEQRPEEKPEDLYQRILATVEDNLLTQNGGITHHGQVIDVDEELTPTLENFVVLTWLRLLHKDLPALIKQRYCPELRHRSLASIKPEISQALPALSKLNKPVAICLQGIEIVTAETVRNLGVIMDSHLKLTAHINHVFKVSMHHLRNVSKIRRYLTPEACKSFVHACYLPY